MSHQYNSRTRPPSPRAHAILAAAALATIPATAADIAGTIVLKGTPPPETVIQFPAGDPTCGKMHTTPLKTRLYVVGPQGELADTFVHVIEGLQAKPPPSDKPLLLDQIKCEYVPYVAGLQTGQRLLIRNSDPFLHNVRTTPVKESGNKEFNLAQLQGTKDIEVRVPNPEVFLRFKCDVHAWMFAYLGVVDHPYFATSDKAGRFRIAGLPPGTYTVEAYHRKVGKVTQRVELGPDDKEREVHFTMELKPAP